MTTQRQSRFSWNLGGLIGSAVGYSAWMALTPFLANWHVSGIVAALLCVVLILMAVPILWQMRAKIEPLSGILILLAAAFTSMSCFLLIAHFTGLPVIAGLPPYDMVKASDFFWALLIFPALGTLFWFMDRSINPKSNSSKPYWFPAKTYGWGWGFPSVWQGWVVFIIFIAIVSVLPFMIDPDENILLFLAAVIGSAGALIGVCYAKGEPPKWRWGRSDNDQK